MNNVSTKNMRTKAAPQPTEIALAIRLEHLLVNAQWQVVLFAVKGVHVVVRSSTGCEQDLGGLPGGSGNARG